MKNSVPVLLALLMPSILSAEPIEITASISTTSNDPTSSLGRAVSKLCTQFEGVSGLGSDAQDLKDVCDQLGTADPNEVNNALESLSSKTTTVITGMLMHAPGGRNGVGVGKRLAALRRAAKEVTIAKTEHIKSKIAVSNSTLLSSIGGNAGDDLDAASKWSGFVSGDFALSNQDESLLESGYGANAQQISAGLDYRINDKSYAGVATGYYHGDFTLDGKNGDLKAHDVSMTLYGTYLPTQKTFIESTLSYGHQFFSFSRKIDFTLNSLTVNETANSSPNANQFSFTLGTGYDLFWKKMNFSFSTNLLYSLAALDPYEESDAGGYSLAVDAQGFNSLIINLGMQVTHAISTKWAVFVPQMGVFYNQELLQQEQDITAHFIHDPLKTEFSFTTQTIDSGYMNINLGTTMVLPGGTTGFIQFETTQLFERYQEFKIALGGRIEF